MITPKSEKELLKVLLEMNINNICHSEEETDDILTSSGMDLEQISQNASNFFKSLRESQKDWREKTNEINSYQNKYDEQSVASKLDRTSILNKIFAFQKGSKFKFAFRNQNPDEMSDDDLISLLKSLEFQQKMENNNEENE